MPPTTVLVFGHPAGSVSVLHQDAGQLGERFGLQPEELAGLAALSGFVDAALARAA